MLRLREIGLIACLAVATFILLAVYSYSPSDPAWTFSGAGNDVHNWVGRSGAYVADLLLLAFGLVAYLVPPSLAYAGVRILRTNNKFSWAMLVTRSLSWVVMLMAFSVLLAMHWLPVDYLPASIGGAVGQWLKFGGLPVFGSVGLTLIALTALLISLQMTFGFSWMKVVESIGRAVNRLSVMIVTGIERYMAMMKAIFQHRKDKQNNRQARSRALHAFEVRKRTKTSPKIEPPKQPKPKLAMRQKKLFTGGEHLPDLELLDDDTNDSQLGYSEESLNAMSRLLELKLKDFGIDAEVVSVLPGPVVTRFEVQPAAGVKVQRITSLVKDLARSLAVISVRVVEVIPGKSVVGIEIPNEHRETVRLKELFESEIFQASKSPLTLALGKDIAGECVVADMTKMPHLLVAGTTGSGKSVGVNAMLLSILCKATPDEVRMILVDPKMLELSIYEGIPHLLTPVVTDMKDAAQALNWCVAEMERRYRLMASLSVRNLAGFNRQVVEAEKRDKPLLDPLWPAENEEPPPLLEPLPLIVVVIDEFADMMMIVGKKVEQLIARIAQKARAAGIHMVLATQRPSVDVITGLIKANIPTRISFQVSSKVDSRTVLDQGGAEQLLGYGDMLFLPPGSGIPRRVHGAFVSDEEVQRIVADWKQKGAPDYRTEVLSRGLENGFPGFESDGTTEQEDDLYDEAVAFVLKSRRASISAVQRKLRIGYNRAARLVEAMEAAGLVSEMNTNGSREVLVPERN